jgi:transmembrane sensor
MDPQCLQDAALWRLRLDENPGAPQLDAIELWLEQPGNLAAFERVGTTLQELETLCGDPRMRPVQQAALGRARRVRRRRHRQRAALGIAGAAAVLLIIGGVLRPRSGRTSTYSTGIGQRRMAAMADGSRIWLDSMTTVRVHYTQHARTLELQRGRARFDVAHNAARPFMVTARNETVVATGTSFDVELLSSNVLVALTEGSVVVTAAPQHGVPAQSVTLKAGEELIVSQQGQVQISDVTRQQANAWQDGKLLFFNEPISEALDRINRYRRQPILLDPALSDLRVSGVFNADESTAFVRAVSSYFQVVTRTLPDGQILLQRRAGAQPQPAD